MFSATNAVSYLYLKRVALKLKGGFIVMDDKKVVIISVSLLMISVFILGFITFGVMREMSTIENKIAELNDKKEQVSDEAHVDKPVELVDNTSATVDDVEGDATEMISASEIGEEVIELQNVLADLFCMDGHRTSGIIDMRLKEGPKLGKRLAELTDIDEDRYQYESWKLNNDWTIELASVIEYEKTDRIPVVFAITTEDGERIGLIKAEYDVAAHQLTNIEKHYPSISGAGLFKSIGGG